MKPNDLIGHRFTRLVVIARGENVRGATRWICKCDCGNQTLVWAASLRNGDTQSCGCLQKEIATWQGLRRPKQEHGSFKHGMVGTPTYESYHGAKQRCTNPNAHNYERYGGRGIQFRYASFKDFFADLGVCPPGLTLERRKNHGHYERGNCTWGTSIKQANNKRNNRLVTAFGRTLTLANWARETGIKYGILRTRVHLGWSPEDVLTRPVRPGRR